MLTSAMRLPYARTVRNPLPTADVLIRMPGGKLVFVHRRNPPPGWAFPGGFIDVGETAEEAAVREVREETGLDVTLDSLFHVYSDPQRDPRHHTLTVVFLGRAGGVPSGGDDAAEARAFDPDEIPGNLAFDHHQILADYLHFERTGERPPPRATRESGLGPKERALLLRMARAAILERTFGSTTGANEAPLPTVQQPGTAFVSLHRAGHLRGCIGNLAFDRPLFEIVRDMAAAAAFEDPRFPPVSIEECEDLEIEISVLGRPRAASPAEIVSGWHGVSLLARGRRAVFLPQVARGEGWNRRTLLEQLCLKAGLDADTWQSPEARFEIFPAEIFGEIARKVSES